ncbi:non-canonical purine NTP pyrophosphatase [Solicola sp. PLA-1-18]|uniref:non-canonical purine NTP pyrophosphatase n=1 Tax=Solicola sp. PLA-1-18 TaxID=3380532 RepID=UPI003B7A0BFA
MTPPRRTVVLATHNHKKLAELRRIVTPAVPDVEVLGLDDIGDFEEPVEDAPTFEGNALIKARAAFAATGIPSLADDSGLCVDALNGMPGVLSARWSGPPKSDERNNTLLLAQLEDVPDERRGAQFRCAMAMVDGSVERVETGEMRGHLLRAPQGDGGFGYDPLFVAEGYDGVSTAELSPEDKDAISHRGRALVLMVPHVAALIS